MTKKELELFTYLLKLSTSIQTLYTKLYNMEINSEKETEDYSKTLGILEDAIEIEEMEYFKNRKNIKLIDNLIHFINNPVISLEIPKSLFDKTTPLARIYFRLLTLTRDLDYKRNCYNEKEIEEIEQYASFDTLLNEEMEEQYEPFLMYKELIIGMLSKFSKMVNKDSFKTPKVIEQKYLYSYIYDYIETVLMSNKFKDNFDYPIMLKEIEYLKINRESYDYNKNQLLLRESGRIMNNLLYENQDKIPTLMDKAYFEFITESLSLEDIVALENLYNIQTKNVLKGYKPHHSKLNMVKKIIERAINNKLDEYDIEKYVKRL